MEAKPNRGGAPRKTASLKRERRVEIRFTDDEYKELETRKKRTVTSELATFIRDACLQKPMRLKPVTTTHEETILALVRETRHDILRVAVNINQCSKRINSTTDYRDLQRETMGLSDNVKTINDQLDLLINQLTQTKPVVSETDNGSPN